MIGKEHEKVTIGNIRLNVVPAKNDLTIVVQDKRKKDMIIKDTLTRANTKVKGAPQQPSMPAGVSNRTAGVSRRWRRRGTPSLAV